MSDRPTPLEGWLREMAAEHAGNIRVGLLVDGKRLHRRELESLADSSTEHGWFALETEVNTTERYRCRIENNTVTSVEYHRHHTPMVPDEFPNNEGELVVELTVNDSTPDSLPRSEPPEITASFLLEAQKREIEGLDGLWSPRVAGLDVEKTALRNFLTQSLADWGLREETGMLLQGAPGTGKTELVKSVCEELYGGVPETIEGPEVMSRWVGESEATLRRTFKRARDSAVPVLYIDEVDAIGASRASSTQDYTAQLVSQLLVLLDGISTKDRASVDGEQFQVIASTNAPGELDPALTRPGRLGDTRVMINRPDENERRAIFHHYLERIYAEADALNQQLTRVVKKHPHQLRDSIVKNTENYTGADIERVVRVAAREAMTSDSELTADLLSDAIEETADELPTEPVDDP